MPDWWAIGTPLLQNQAEVDTEDLAALAVETAKIAALNVTSEKLSVTALQRSVVIPLPDLAAGTTAPLTSAYQVWAPEKAVVLTRLLLTPMTSWVQTTVQSTVVGTLYNGDDAVATVVIPTTNAPGRGTALTFSSLSNATVSSGTALTFGLPTATSAGMDAPGHFLQIDFVSSA